MVNINVPVRAHDPDGNPLVRLSDVVETLNDLAYEVAVWKRKAASMSREMKKQETKSVESSGFDAFWSAWPAHQRKVNRKACLVRWNAGGLEALAKQVIEHVESMKLSADWAKDAGRYIPAPLVYLNQERYLAPVGAKAVGIGSLGHMNYRPTGVDEHGFFS